MFLAGFSRYVPMNFHGFPMKCGDFPMVFLWFSHEKLWLSYGFPMVFPWKIVIVLWFSNRIFIKQLVSRESRLLPPTSFAARILWRTFRDLAKRGARVVAARGERRDFKVQVGRSGWNSGIFMEYHGDLLWFSYKQMVISWNIMVISWGLVCILIPLDWTLDKKHWYASWVGLEMDGISPIIYSNF